MKLFAAFFTACLLTACGGGGGGDPSPVGDCAPFVDSFGQAVSCAEMKALPGSELAYLEPGGGGGDGGSGDSGGDGSAGDGAPIANTNLRFTDVNGKVVNTSTDARGRYRINLRGLQPPLVATVVRDGKPWKSMLVADIVRAPANRKFYTINLTGLTDYVVSEVAKKDGLAGADAITPAAVARQKAQVPLIIAALNTALRTQITTAGLDANTFDPLAKPFQAVLTDSYDKLLESLNVTRDPTGPTLVTPVYTLGGSIGGLGGASGLTLVNGTETLPIAANATSFTLATKLAQGTNYDITVGTQPVGLICTVSSNGKGVVGSNAISNVAVNCGANSFTLGGTVAGLGNATGLQLSNGGQLLSIAPNQSSFVFANGLSPGASYSVTVQTQPAGLTCSVAGGAGTMGTAAVSNVAVTCAGNSYTLGGSVTGLSGGSLLLISGGQSVSVAAGASSFVFPNAVAVGSAYNVAVQTAPANLSCSVSNATGTITTGPVSNVAVTCVVNSYTVGGSVAGLSAGSLVLSSGGQSVSVAAGAGSFVFPNALASGLTYNVTVQTQPATLLCSVSNGAGTVFAGPVSNVLVNCIPRTYTLGGSVRGLSAGGLLLVNAEQGLSVPANVIGFEFGAPLAAGSPYNVTVEAQPTGLICSVANGSGTVVAANVTTVAVTCLPVGPMATVSTLAGNGKPGFFDGSGVAASFTQPRGVAVDASGNVYVADQLNHAIRKIGPGSLVSTLAGIGKPDYGDGEASGASFNTPSGVAVDSSGNVYVADTQNHAIRMISPAGLVSTFAGNGTPGFVNGRAGAASFNNPIGIAVDSRDTLYVADSANHAIRAISQKGDVTTLAGTGKSGFVNGTGTAASFSGPTGVAVDSSGSVYVADLGNVVVRKINSAGVVSTLAGSGKFGFADGVGVAASFNDPAGVAVDSSGNVYVADVVNEAIRKISPAGVVTTLAGAGKGSAGFVNGTGVDARFSSPSGVAADSNGNVYVADVLNHAIRKIAP
jgi:sugar lactone lactonase YvrE